MAFYLLRMSIASFFPLSERHESRALSSRSAAQEQDEEQFASAYFDAWWQTLRQYFGPHHLPPEDQLEAFLQHNTLDALEPWEHWQWEVEQAQPTLQEEFLSFFSPSTDQLHPVYIEIGHRHHHDLLSLLDGSAELLFRHWDDQGDSDDSQMREILFQPLLHRLQAAHLSLHQLSMHLTWASETGLHSTTLPTLLHILDLL